MKGSVCINVSELSEENKFGFVLFFYCRNCSYITQSCIKWFLSLDRGGELHH